MLGICPSQSEQYLRFNEVSLCSKEEEVVIKRRGGEEGKEREALYGEANKVKSSECRNGYGAHTYAFREQNKKHSAG